MVIYDMFVRFSEVNHVSNSAGSIELHGIPEKYIAIVVGLQHSCGCSHNRSYELQMPETLHSFCGRSADYDVPSVSFYVEEIV